ncbi:MAG: YDG domain-containing protein [Sulfuritalea sp.]|nr:YDG domain-containing protein [Sulfuritalea sp.]
MSFSGASMLGGNVTVSGGGGSNSGTLTLGAGAVLDYTGGSHAFASATTVGGTGTLTLSGATWTGAGTVSLDSGGLNWTGGTLAVGGAGGVTVATGRALAIGGAAAKTLDGGKLTNAGTITWTGAGNLVLNNGAQLTNNALLDIQTDADFQYTSGVAPSLSNTGTLRKSSGALDTVIGLTNPFAFGNSGNIDVQLGTLNVQGGGFSHTGTMNLAPGATFQRTGGFTNAGIVQGRGTVDVGAGNTLANVGGTLRPAGVGAVGTLAVMGNLNLAGGTIEIDLGGTAAGLSDKLSASGNVTLGGTLNASLTGGYLPVNADFIPIVAMTGTASGTFASAILPANMDAGYNLAAGEASRLIFSTVGTKTFLNTASDLNWATPANWSGGAVPGSGNTALISSGFAVAHPTGNDTIAALTVNSGNSLNVSGGSLTVSGATTVGGSLAVSGGTLVLNGTSSVQTLGMTGGVLNGSGNVSVASAFDWTGGTLGLAGALTAPVINVGGATTGSGSLVLRSHGDIVFAAGSSLTSASASPVNVVLNADTDGLNGGAIVMNTGSSIVSGGGNVTLGGGTAGNGSGKALGNATYASGIELTGATINAGGGNIALRGQGDALGTTNMGVHLSAASVSTTGTGSIVIDGTGGGDATGTSNRGVRFGSGSTVATGLGAIGITGLGGWDGDGVQVMGASTIQSTTGAITIQGTSGAGDGGDYGVYVTASNVASGNTLITTGGNISIGGTSGNTTAGSSNRGTSVGTRSRIIATGAGTIGITGQGGFDSDGVVVHNGALVQTTSGTLTLSGTSGNGGTSNYGVELASLGTTVSSTSGAIGITGTSLTTVGTSNRGLAIGSSAQVSNGSGTISLTGIGGYDGDGINISSAQVQATTGAVTLTGTSGTGPSAERGIFIGGSSTALVQGGGNVTLNGTSIATTDVNNYGILLNLGSIRSTGGNVALNGEASAGTSNAGIRILDVVNAAGTATLQSGTGIVIESGGLIASAASGSAVVLAAGNKFINNAGTGAFSLTGAGTPRWLVYAASPASVSKGGLSSNFRHYNATYASYANPVETGNGFIYSSAAGTLTVNATATGTPNHIYGDAPTASFGYTLAGFADAEDNAGNIGIAGSPVFNVPIPTAASDAGSYSVSYVGNLSSSPGYGYTFGAGTGLAYSITAAPLTVSASNQGKVYGDTLGFAGTEFVAVGLKNGQTVGGVTLASSGAGALAGVGGSPYAITASAAAGGSFNPANYSISYSNGALTVTPRPLTASFAAQIKTYDGNTGVAILPAPTFGNAIAADLASLGLTGSASYDTRHVGSGKTVTYSGLTLSGGTAGNYSLGTGAALGSGSIAQLDSVAWTGGATGNWSVAANWAGNALPDGSNVLAVNIPAGTTVSFDAGTAATQLNSLAVGSGGGFIMAGSSLGIAASLTTPAYTQTGGTLNGAGTLSATQSFSKSGGSLALAGLVTITQAAGTLTLNYDAPLTLGAVSTVSGNILVDASGGIFTTASPVTANGGSLAFTAHSPIHVGSGGLAATAGLSLSAPTPSAGSTVTLDGPLSAGGAVNVSAHGAIAQNAGIQGQSIALTSTGGNIVLAGGAVSSVPAGGSIGYSASAGSITSSPANFAGATPSLVSSAGTIADTTTTTTTTTNDIATTVTKATEALADDPVEVPATPPPATTETSGGPIMLASISQTTGGETGTFGAVTPEPTVGAGSTAISPAPETTPASTGPAPASTPAADSAAPENAPAKPEAAKEASTQTDEKKDEKKDEAKKKDEQKEEKKEERRAAAKKVAQCS